MLAIKHIWRAKLYTDQSQFVTGVARRLPATSRDTTVFKYHNCNKNRISISETPDDLGDETRCFIMS